MGAAWRLGSRSVVDPLRLALAVIANLVLIWRWRVARWRNDHRINIVVSARDQRDHLLVYLLAMLLPLYAANLTSGRELASAAVAFELSEKYAATKALRADVESGAMAAVKALYAEEEWEVNACALADPTRLAYCFWVFRDDRKRKLLGVR